MVGTQRQIYNFLREFTFFRTRQLSVSLVMLLILLSALATRHVIAHSGDVFLSRTDPPINAALPRSPEVIRLWFEDPLMGEFSRFQLRDINTRLIKTVPSQIGADDPKELFMPLETELPDGLYTVTYQVISAADGHEGVGSFAFIVGQVSDTWGNLLAYNEGISGAYAGVRGLHVLALVIILGGGFYAGLIVKAGRHIYRAITAGWIFYGFAQFGLLWLQVTMLIIPDTGDFSDLLFRYLTGTRFGMIWCITMVVWLLIGLFITRQSWAWVFVGAGVILAGFASVAGRVTTTSEMFAAIAVYWLHSVSSGLWLGGLLFVAFDQLIVRRTDAGIGQKSVQFSAIALPLIAITGLYNSWLRVGTLDGVSNTGYGHALILKVLLVAAFVVMFTYSVRSMERIKFISYFQIVLGLVVLAVTGIIITLTPSREIVALRNAIPPAFENETTIQELLTVDGLHLQLYVTPGVVGTNRLDVLIFESTTGIRLNDVSRLTLALTSPHGETYQIQSEFQGDGLYTAEGVEMNVPERWDIRMTVTRPSRQAVVAPFTVSVAAPISSSAPVVDLTPPASERLIMAAMAGILHVIVGGLTLFSSDVVRRPLSLRASHALVGLSVVVLAGLFIHPLIYALCGGLLIAWTGMLAGSAGRWARNTGTWGVFLAMASVSVGGILLISAGFIPYTVP